MRKPLLLHLWRIISEYRITGWWVFFLSTQNISLYFLLVCTVSEKSDTTIMLACLEIRCFFLWFISRCFFIFDFQKPKYNRPQCSFLEFILLDLWASWIWDVVVDSLGKFSVIFVSNAVFIPFFSLYCYIPFVVISQFLDILFYFFQCFFSLFYSFGSFLSYPQSLRLFPELCSVNWWAHQRPSLYLLQHFWSLKFIFYSKNSHLCAYYINHMFLPVFCLSINALYWS